MVKPNLAKDIDFLCIGRIEKFAYLEDIWKSIRTRHQSAKFVMIGRVSSGDISRLNSIGIEHLGIVSEGKKVELLSRARVLIFPSEFEGFGIAVTEALSIGLSVVAWQLPVFNERFSEMAEVKLVSMGEVERFGSEALKSLNECEEKLLDKCYQPKFQPDYTWKQVGQNVLLALSDILGIENVSQILNERKLNE